MVTEELKQAIRSLCPDISEDVIQDFFTRIDEDYFTTFSPKEVATHIRMAATLGANHRVEVRVEASTSTQQRGRECDIIIVGFDYLSEFSIFCGLLSAFGLDIRAGNIYSFSNRGPRPSRAKIVDVFSVSIKGGDGFEDAEQRSLERELQTFANLLATGSITEARERLNRFLTEKIETMNLPLAGLLSPVEIQFDNEASSEWTVMEIRSGDSFAFLYAISNALAMNGIDIHNVKARNVGGLVRDQFLIRDRWGRKIQEGQAQDKLRLAVSMMKQFTRFLVEAPDPAIAMRHFDQLIDKVAAEGYPDDVLSFLASEQGMARLARLFGSSDFLWDDFLRAHPQDLLHILENSIIQDKESMRRSLRSQLQSAGGLEEKKRSLNAFKDREVFLIEAQHLLEPHVTLKDFSDALTNLAEIVVDEAAKICREHLGDGHGPFAICGLGKFGGREMGYASDLELMFVHDDQSSTPFFETLTRQTIEFIDSRAKGIFHVDLRLRPYGDAGVWSISFAEFQRYYSPDGDAAPFERQALIKLRLIAGDPTLGRQIETHRDAFTYSGAPWDNDDALHLRQRQINELVKSNETNVKYGAGGIVDVEYAVQYLQLLHGRDRPELRLANTLEALEALRHSGIIDNSDYLLLNSAYLFLRALIDALRIVRGDASDLVLPLESSDEFKSLARRLGYNERDRKMAAMRLAADIREWMTKVHAYFLRRFGKT